MCLGPALAVARARYASPRRFPGPFEGVSKCGDRATVTLLRISAARKSLVAVTGKPVRPTQCPLCPDSDQIPQRSEMTRCVNCRDGATVCHDGLLVIEHSQEQAYETQARDGGHRSSVCLCRTSGHDD